MLPVEARDVRRQLADPLAVCERLGFAERAQRQARGLLIRCPWHVDRTPSCSVRQADDGTIAVCCHGCGATGDVLTLVAAANGLDVRRDFREVLRRAAELAGTTLDELPRRPLLPTTHPPGRTYPLTTEVVALWAGCRPVTDDVEVSAWLHSRGLDPGAVEDTDLARALPASLALPRWARYQGRTWAEGGYRHILPLFDEVGAMRSVRARRVVAGDGPKALPPAGHRTGGLQLADALGRLLLGAGERPAWWPSTRALRVIVVEGETDFLTWAARLSDANEAAPAVFGIVAGSWTRAIAARVPDGTRVIVRTDADEAGDRYAAAVARTVGERCELLRAGAAP